MTGLIQITPEVADAFAAAIKPRLEELKATWEREGPAALETFAGTGADLDMIGGNCPVQAEGSVDGKRFYFRARGTHWQFHVADSEAEIFDKPLLYIDHLYSDEPYAAGWMPEHEALGFIVEGIKRYRIARDLGDAYEAQGNPGTFEDWVQNMADDPRGTLQEAAKAWLEPSL